MSNEKESVAIRIPGYVIEREIGRGGVATVFLAIQQSLDRKVALKVMSPALAAEPDFSVRFEREGRVVAGFSHPNIVTIYDVGVSNFQHYIAMEYLGSGSLKRHFAGPMDPHKALKIVREISAALGYAHKHGYVHRDVKPENILFKSDGVAVLTDFGIAKSSNSNTQLTRSGTIVGTPRYMSPEQAHGNPATPQSDIYALGVILFEMLSGRPPYDTAESVAVLYAHINDPIPELPEAGRALQPLVDAMMAKNFENRVPDCETLSDLVVMMERELDSPTGSHRKIWRPITSVEQQRRDNATGTGDPHSEVSFEGRPVESAELQKAVLGTGAQTPLNIPQAKTGRRVGRAKLYTGISAVAAVFIAAVLLRNGTIQDLINPAPELPKATSVLSDDETVPDEEIESTADTGGESNQSAPVDGTQVLAANGNSEQGIDAQSDTIDTDASTSVSQTATEVSDSASVDEESTDQPPSLATERNLGDDPSLVTADAEPSVDIDTVVPTATGTVVDPATVSGTVLAPPAPGTNVTPNEASDIATIAVSPESDGASDSSIVLDETELEAVDEEVAAAEVVIDQSVAISDESEPPEATETVDETQEEPAQNTVQGDTVEVVVTDTAETDAQTVPEPTTEDGVSVAATGDASSQSILPPPTEQNESGIAAMSTGFGAEDIPTLLLDANILVGDNKLAHPPNDNAVELYQTILQIQPDNIDAREGLHDIAGTYLTAAEEKIQLSELALAALEIERGLKARPDHSRLIELQGEVRDMIEANAAYAEAENYFFGLDGPIDLVRSCDRYLEAAEKGHTEAALGLGICFANGFGFEQDEQQAIRWMNFAAEAEEPEALYNLALGLLFGDSPDPEQAAEYIRQAADLGYERAYRVLGWMHQTGTGVDQSTRDAVKWGFRGALNERSETDSSTRKVVERWESVFQDAYNEAVTPEDDQDESSS